MYKKRIWIGSITGLLVVAGLCLGFEKNVKVKETVVINEVCSFNVRTIKDGIHDGSDYVELYNGTENVISLKGWHISDNDNEMSKYTFPECEISPGEHLTLYSNGTEEDLLLPFGVNYAGEMLFLSDADGNLVDSVVVPALDADETYARKTDGANEWRILEPSVDGSNDLSAEIIQPTLNSPKFSAKTGFYDEAFYLKLDAKRDETIYYTTDGTIPDENSLKYESPILIENISDQPNKYISQLKVVEYWKEYEPNPELVDKATVVNAIAVNDRGEISEMASEVYFVNLPEYEDKLVISLTVDPEELFGEYGIFVTGKEFDEWYENEDSEEIPISNFRKRGKAWEVLADMNLLQDGEIELKQKVGLRTQGNSGRIHPLKRISLFAREEYSGNDYFEKKLLEKENVHSLMINEFVSNMALPRLVEDRAVGVQKSIVEPANVFINGEYWYTRYVMEKFNRQYLVGTYGVKEDNVIILKNNEIHTGHPDDIELYREIQEIASSEELTPDEKYDILNDLIDMQSFIDFFSISAYLCNMNMSEEENYVLWRTIDSEDGIYGDQKWRWLLYDVEAIESLRPEFYSATERASIDSFNHPMEWNFNIMSHNTIFAGLKKCERFKERFAISFMDIANSNFEVNRVDELLREYGETVDWLEGFFVKRKGYMSAYLYDELSLDGTLESVTLVTSDEAAGTIQINTTQANMRDGIWQGDYFTDYPITVTAKANPGYRFVGWMGDVEGEEHTMEVAVKEGGIYLMALFEEE